MTVETAVDRPEIRLERDDLGVLKLLRPDEAPMDVKVTRLFPLTNPMQYIVISDTEGHEVMTLKDIGELDMESGNTIRAELERTYFLPRIKHILSIKDSLGMLQWSVQTDRGPRSFEVRSRDDIRFLMHHGRLHIIIKDLDGNRFEIWDPSRLDPSSRAILDRSL
jgi:hypothetical protein